MNRVLIGPCPLFATLRVAALAAAFAILAFNAVLPAFPAPGLWALKQYAAPQAPLLVLAIVTAIGAVVALVADLANRDAARSDPLRSAALVALILSLTLPAADIALTVAALPPTMARALRTDDRVTPLLIALALGAALCGVGFGGAPLLVWAALRLARSAPRHAANDNRPPLLSPLPAMRLASHHASFARPFIMGRGKTRHVREG